MVYIIDARHRVEKNRTTVVEQTAQRNLSVNSQYNIVLSASNSFDLQVTTTVLL